MNQSSLDYAKKFPANTNWVQLITNSIELSLLSHNDWRLNWDKIEPLLSKGMLILDCSTDPFNGHEQSVKQQLISITDNFCILSGDLNYFKNPDSHVVYYPTFYIEMIEQRKHAVSVITNKKRKWPISCLNGRSRIHRVENFVKLKRKPYFDQLLFRIHSKFDINNELSEYGLEFCDESILKEFNDLQCRFHTKELTTMFTAAPIEHTQTHI
jgi:hypothetical protein